MTIVETELAAALRSWRIQLIDDAITIENTINVAIQPKAPASGEIKTTTKLAITAAVAPSKSESNCFGVAFHGFIGFGTED